MTVISDLKAYESMQKRIFESAQEPDIERVFVPVGRCPRHPQQSTGNGMFDSPCPLCEMENC